MCSLVVSRKRILSALGQEFCMSKLSVKMKKETEVFAFALFPQSDKSGC